MLPNEYRDKVKEAALALKPRSVYRWLTTEGYFPEPHVLPPCFSVEDAPVAPKELHVYKEKVEGGSSRVCPAYPVLSEV